MTTRYARTQRAQSNCRANDVVIVTLQLLVFFFIFFFFQSFNSVFTISYRSFGVVFQSNRRRRDLKVFQEISCVSNAIFSTILSLCNNSTCKKLRTIHVRFNMKSKYNNLSYDRSNSQFIF